MNAMLEPRIVAASTHGRDFSAHGAAKAPDRITASSHGCFISNVDAHGLRTDSALVATWVCSGVRRVAIREQYSLRSQLAQFRVSGLASVVCSPLGDTAGQSALPASGPAAFAYLICTGVAASGSDSLASLRIGPQSYKNTSRGRHMETQPPIVRLS